jgi:hypothetical protein
MVAVPGAEQQPEDMSKVELASAPEAEKPKTTAE